MGAARHAEHEAARARALVLEGCYDCLLDARAILESNVSARDSGRDIELLFEVELLVALREKELGLDSTASLARARRLQTRFPAGVNADRLVMLAEAVAPEEAAWPAQAYRTFLSQHRPVREQLSHWLQWLKTGPASPTVRQYLSLALACTYAPDASGRPDDGPSPALADPPPLLQYRAAACSGTDTTGLLELRRRVPRFLEIAFVLARRELRFLQAGGSARAIPYLDDVHRRFSGSPAVTYLSGIARQVLGDCRAATSFFAQTTAIQPVHERALLATTICSSHLGRHSEAIETASRLIELGGPNTGDAYYWRSWNRHRRRELSDAAHDIDRAKTLVYNEAVLTLSGIIAYDVGSLDDADRDLTSAKAAHANSGNCTAMWYLGLVNFKRERWSASARDFADASVCYERQARATEALLDDLLRRTDVPAAFRERQLASLQSDLTESRTQQGAAAYNAALNFIRGGDPTSAATYADRAARDPAHAAGVEELRRLMKRPRP